MKRAILIIPAVMLVFSCGGKKEDKKDNASDTSKVDTTASQTEVVDTTPKVKDYSYYASMFKNPQIEGVELKQNSLNEEEKNKSLNANYDVVNSDAVGYHEIRFAIDNPAMYMGDQKEKYTNYTLESFNHFQNLNREKGTKAVKGVEYKTGDLTFYWGTEKNMKGSFGSKDYNKVTIEGKSGDLILRALIIVEDVKADMAKAETGAQRVADFMAK